MVFILDFTQIIIGTIPILFIGEVVSILDLDGIHHTTHTHLFIVFILRFIMIIITPIGITTAITDILDITTTTITTMLTTTIIILIIILMVQEEVLHQIIEA